MQNSAKDNEMVALKTNWIEKAIFENRIPRISKEDDVEKYKKEFQKYYMLVRIFNKLSSIYNILY